MLKRLITVLVVVLLAAVGWVAYRAFSATGAPSSLYSGVVEATIYQLAFERAGTIDRLLVKEGQRVRKGTLIARLDDRLVRDDLEQARARLGQARANLTTLLEGPRPQEIQQARARVQAARAQLDELVNGPLPEEVEENRAAMLSARDHANLVQVGSRGEDIRAARSQVLAGRSNLHVAAMDYDRYRKLFAEDAIPAQQLDSYRNKYEVATQNLKNANEEYRKLVAGNRPQEKAGAYEDFKGRQAQYQFVARGTREERIRGSRASLAAEQSQLALLEAGSRTSDVQAGRQRVKEAEGAVASLQTQLEKTRLYAPADSVVTVKTFEEKETVAAGVPAYTLEDLDHPWVNIFVPETVIGRVKLSQKAAVTVDSLPGKRFSGSVGRIYENAEFTPKNVQTQEERVKLVFRTKVYVENPELALKPGMSADVHLQTP